MMTLACAASSGETLEEQFEEAGQTISGTLADHVELGDQVKIFAFVFLAAVVGWVVMARRDRLAGADGTIRTIWSRGVALRSPTTTRSSGARTGRERSITASISAVWPSALRASTSAPARSNSSATR